jgi:hypothetical protein
MKLAIILAVTLATGAHCVAQETDVEQLLADADPPVQEQIAKTYAAFGRHQFEPIGHVEPFQELEDLKDAVADEEELVRQLAIFAATPKGDEQRPLAAAVILSWLHVPPNVAIRVLASYLDTDDSKLRAFVYDVFHGLDNTDSVAFVSVNYNDYLEYIRWMVHHEKELPAPFVNYIYERSPAQALLVFRIATVDHRDYMQILRKSVEAAQEGRGPTAQEREEMRQVQEAGRREGRAQREILLAEHIVSNALWLHKNGFNERFQAALPEAMAELEKLAEHEAWWARLYVVYIMRQNPALLKAHTLRQLAEDENALVREAVMSRRGQ